MASEAKFSSVGFELSTERVDYGALPEAVDNIVAAAHGLK